MVNETRCLHEMLTISGKSTCAQCLGHDDAMALFLAGMTEYVDPAALRWLQSIDDGEKTSRRTFGQYFYDNAYARIVGGAA